MLSRLTNDLLVHCAAGEHCIAHLVVFSLRYEVSADFCCCNSFFNFFVLGLGNEHGLLACADDTIVEAAACDDLVDSVLDVYVIVNDSLNVTSANAESGTTGRVCSCNHASAACSDSDVSIGDEHLCVDTAVIVYELDQIFGSAVLLQCCTHVLDCLLGALCCAVVSGNDDSIAALQSEHCVRHGSNDGVCNRCDSANDTDGLSNLYDTFCVVILDDVNRLLALEIPSDMSGLILILSCLVSYVAHLCDLNCQLSQLSCVIMNSLSNSCNQNVNLLLVVCSDYCLCFFSVLEQFTHISI